MRMQYILYSYEIVFVKRLATSSPRPRMEKAPWVSARKMLVWAVVCSRPVHRCTTAKHCPRFLIFTTEKGSLVYHMFLLYNREHLLC